MIAREYGFSSWPRLKEHAEGTYGDLSQRIDHFLRWACSTEARGPDGGHLARAKAALAESPELAAADISIQIALGDAEAVRKAIETDPDFARFACGLREWIPLPYSVHSCFHTDPQYADGIAECAQLLLDLGADPNAGTSSMGTDRSESEFPILLSAIERTRNVHFVEQLLIVGADPVTTGAYYNTWTCTDTAIPELLYAHGAPVNGLEFEMHCPGILLHRLRANPDDTSSLGWFLERGADPNIRNPGTRHRVPLHGAVEHASPPVLRFLLDHGADPTIKNDDGRSPVGLAVRGGCGESRDPARVWRDR